MPIYDWRLERGEGRPGRAKLFDARGFEYALPIQWCDTDTGEILFVARDSSGQPCIIGDEVITGKTFIEAPLRIKWLDPATPEIELADDD